MYRIALSHHDTDRRRITPRHRDTAHTLGEAIGKVRECLPGVDLGGLVEGEVNASINRVNDFRCDVPSAGADGGEWRVVIAPMM
ncbi:hypothetical protein NGM33_28840 [Nocardiopsis dassonvillei]|uniref:hypothetical protein n=1 Tax=Nocardiopsis dassonvillei TaxID=2014 RepID=UPI0020A2D8E8|nr:hypothetical protein [Nocardiopsis dassonvillei]MCP3017345.1 hypothetical protein [Nocardiopsis dassonvillei]